jgi:hypothetical protein
VLRRAAVYLANLEKEMPVVAPSMHWEMFPTEYNTAYGLRVELDGVDVAQLPLEERTDLGEVEAEAAPDDGAGQVSLRLVTSDTENDDDLGDD